MIWSRTSWGLLVARVFSLMIFPRSLARARLNFVPPASIAPYIVTSLFSFILTHLPEKSKRFKKTLDEFLLLPGKRSWILGLILCKIIV